MVACATNVLVRRTEPAPTHSLALGAMSDTVSLGDRGTSVQVRLCSAADARATLLRQRVPAEPREGVPAARCLY